MPTGFWIVGEAFIPPHEDGLPENNGTGTQQNRTYKPANSYGGGGSVADYPDGAKEFASAGTGTGTLSMTHFTTSAGSAGEPYRKPQLSGEIQMVPHLGGLP
ncbi:hypothetical protein E4U41_001258 [Claviceps citrina]|nr:hypothetical protein E4U41_001258 [Claviceps citrina]